MLNTKKIDKAMAEGKITKARLCSDTGIARSTLDAILNGSDAKISTIESIAGYLGVKISYLFDEEGDVRSAARDYVEKGKIEHHGTEYNGNSIEADLRDQIAILKSQLADKERIIHLMENQTK